MTGLHGPALVFAIPLIAALVIAAAALRRNRLAHAIATIAAAAAAAAAWALLLEAAADGPIRYRVAGWAPPWGIELVVDRMGAFVAAVVATVATLALAGSRRSADAELDARAPAFYATAQLALAGLLGMCVTGDAFNLFVFLELASLAGYALIGCGRGRSQLAAFRYLMLGATGASLYLLGIGYLYVATGTLNMADLATRIPGTGLAPIALAFVVAGLALKMGLFPLHAWVPDAYSEAPSPAVSFVAPIFTKVMALAMLRFVVDVFGGAGDFGPVSAGELLAWTGAVAAAVGAATASSQVAIRRLLAWSSVGHIGYIAMGIGIGTDLAVAAALLHVMNHALMKGALFWAVSATGATTLDDLRGLARRAPVVAACAAVAVLSLAGLPPLAGFFSKWYLLQAAIDAGQPGLAIAVVVGSLLSMFYAFRLVELMYLRDGSSDARQPVPASVIAPLATAAIALVVTGPMSARILVAWLAGGGG